MPIEVMREPTVKGWHRILIYSDPKSGKTRLATSLPSSWGKILYVAEDDNSESLAPVLEKYRSNITVVKSRPTYDGKYDPVAEAFAIAMGWKEILPDAGTMIWDTMSSSGDKFLKYIAEKGQFSQTQHITVGAMDGPGKQVIPMQGDYGGAQNVISNLTSFLMQQPLHLIVLCHAKYDEPQTGETVEGGPATVGNATVRTYSKPFDTVIHLGKRSFGGGPGQDTKCVVVAHTERHGIWQASIREGKGRNPMPKVELKPDPIDFWNLYESSF